MAAHCRPSTRATSATGSRSPDLGQPAVDDHREAAELDDAGAERGLGAQRRLVEEQGDAARTGQRADLVRVGLEGVGQVQHGGLLGGGQVVVGQEVAKRHAARVQQAGQCGDEGVQLVGGDHQRRRQPEHVGPGGVDDEAGVQRGVGDGGGDRGGQGDGPQQASAAYAGDGRVAESEYGIGQVSAEVVRPLEQPVALDHGDHRQPGDGRHRVATEGAAVAAGTQQGRRATVGDARPDREPVAEALGHGDEVSGDPLGHVDQPAAGPAHPGLHLVDPEQGAGGVTELPGPGQVADRGHDHAVLPLDRLEHHRGHACRRLRRPGPPRRRRARR